MTKTRTCPCGGLIVAQTCDRCGPRNVYRHRGNSTERGYGGRWKRASERYKRLHPLCVCCQAMGIATGERGRTGILVDHIVPAWVAPELFWDESNWQTLCHQCDQKYKKPIERRLGTPDAIRSAWAQLIDKHSLHSGPAIYQGESWWDQ